MDNLLGFPHSYLGLTIQVSPILGPRPIPIKIYKKRKWTTQARIDRVQKKWTKKHGTELKDDVIIMKDMNLLLVSKENYAAIEKAVQAEKRKSNGH